MIVRDVEATIAEGLESVKDIFDEIVVVDTGSKDKTVEIVSRYTDKLYFFEWINDFSAARNYSFEMCTGEHIAWMDGDDSIPASEAKKIKELDLSDKDIVICHYQYAHDEYGNCISVVPRERIVRRSLGLKWQEPIHEYLPLDKPVYVSDIQAPYHRKQHSTSERNLAILEKIVAKDPKRPRNLYYLGREYHDFGKTDLAIKYLEKFLASRDPWWEDSLHAHEMLAQDYLAKKDDAQFKFHLFASISTEERRAEPFYHLAFYYEMNGQLDKAIQWYEMCLLIDRPKGLLSSHQPDYYTWRPHLQLCVCYNAIGKIREAYEHNEKVLQYRPQDSMALNNRKILAPALSKKTFVDGGLKRLNLGCGNKPLPGYVNVDIFKGPAVDEVFEFDQIPYSDGTIDALHSEHALEHVTFERAEKAIQEWFRVLRPGGELLLYMPDFERCCQAYLNAPLEDPTFKQTRAWYKATIFGIQQGQAGEPDEAQIHKSGFSKQEIQIVLERNGFIVDYAVNYGGPGQKSDYGTPSMGIRALKPVSPIKIGWICPENWDAAQTRIRVLRVHQWFKARGYRSRLVDYPEILSGDYDVAIVGKAFDEGHFRNIRLLKQNGKTVYCDLCESILDFPWVSEILSICDRVICCSDELAKQVQAVNSNTVVIEDAWEF